MTTLLGLLSLLSVTALVAAICGFVARIGATLRAAADSVSAIAACTYAMRHDAAAISPGVESTNQNLYRVAAHLAQLGEAAEQFAERG